MELIMQIVTVVQHVNKESVSNLQNIMIKTKPTD